MLLLHSLPHRDALVHGHALKGICPPQVVSVIAGGNSATAAHKGVAGELSVDSAIAQPACAEATWMSSRTTVSSDGRFACA